MGKHVHKLSPEAYISLVYIACLIAGLALAMWLFGGHH